MSKRKTYVILPKYLFPVKLLKFLNLEKYNDIIAWHNDNCTIIIKNLKEISSLLVSNKISKTKELDSIKKQFNLYGFKIENINNKIYKIRHPIFRKNISDQELNSIRRNNIYSNNIHNNKNIYEMHSNEIEQSRKKRKVNVRGKSIEFCLNAVSDEVDKLENSDDIFDIEFLQNIKINELIGNNIFRKNKSSIIMEQFDNYIKDCKLFEEFTDYHISYNDICEI